MKNLYRTIILILSLVFVGLFCGEEALAASSSATTKKNYSISNCKIKYTSGTGQIVVQWKDSKKQTNKVAQLYYNGSAVAKDTLECSSWDISGIVQACGPGTYIAEVYPVKLGSDYTITSPDFVVDQNKYSKIENFDPELYEIMDPSFDHDSVNGIVMGRWEENEKVSGKAVRLKKGTSIVSSWQNVSGKSHDFSELIASNGTGTYTFQIYSKKLGDCYAVTSDELEIASDDLKIIKARITAEQKEIESKRIGWVKNGPIVWYYYKDYGVKAKNEWITLDGKTYHFSSAGIMQTGWQAISEKWYYFDTTTGALLKNTTTPDGYTVNAEGAKVDADGNVVSSKGQKQSPATMTTLSSCTISVSETGKEPGVVKEATFKGGTGFSVESYTFDKPYEQWTAGQPVIVTLYVNALPNYKFSSDVKFSARNCKSTTSSGNSEARTVTVWYYPKMQLCAPTSLHITEETNLNWRKAENATRYKVVFTNVDSKESESQFVDTNQIDISGYISDDPVTYTIKVYSMAASKKTSYFTTSAAAEIENLETFIAENSITGTIKWNGMGMKYVDADGNDAKGWYKLMGGWYHFTKNGYADGPGWYQAEDGYWYYFDKEYRMCTGELTVDNKTYFLNDGSVADLPLGAWVEK